jgi:GH35 family endo-1,4-beta-xylanase
MRTHTSRGFTRTLITAAALLAATTLGWMQTTPAPAQGVPAGNPPTPRLKDVYKDVFLVGTALDFRSPTEFNEVELDIIKSQFNIITPENSMKPGSIHPAEDRWNWTVADNLMQFSEANNIKVWGHTLAWHAQTGNWFFEGENNQPVTREKALERLRTHIHTLVGRYKGRIIGWDVVNEAIADSNNGTTENLRQSPWLRAVGPDFLTHAFKFAREADPNVQLYYNDYNIERGAKHQSSLLLLKRLIAEGAPITGVGIQGHWSLTFLPYNELDQAIQNYKALGLRVAITELDITIQGQGGGQLGPVIAGAGTQPGRRGRGELAAGGGPATGPAATGPAATGPGRGRGRGRGVAAVPPTPEQLQAQAQAYARFFEIFQKHKDVIDRVTFWGVNDRRSWRQGQSPLLFDNDNKPKPAIFSISQAKR